MRATVLWLTAACLVPACGFSAPAPASADDDPYPGAGPVPPPSTAERHCATEDPALRLCIDFDDDRFPTTDGSSFHHDATAESISMMPRDQELAVLVGSTSRVVVDETPDLDLVKNLTVTLWARPDGAPPGGQAYWLFDNNRQYFAEYLPNGKFRCGIGTMTVDAALGVQPDHWYHVTCAYDSASQLRVYVNGHRAGCKNANAAAIPTTGTEGLAIGANIDAGPAFSQPFIGGLDNIQVFARTFSAQEACDAAHNTDCLDLCL